MNPSPLDDEFNPYAAPKAKVSTVSHAAPERGVWRVGDDLIMSKDGEFPDRCIRCNAPAEGWRLKKKISWHPSGYYLLILFNLIIYAIVAVIVRHSAKVQFPLCADHRRRRRWAIALGWLLVLGSFPVMIGAAVLSSGLKPPQDDVVNFGGIILGLVMMLVGLICGFYYSRVVSITKIDKRYVWLSKVDPAFLASLPRYGR